ncbi:ATP-binding cassette domain-containing protein [Anianabacter salinae]|uniref:ATP-binding cassette domain-containing protein n=1 Tax=Anianabacter salinae TaxID=2851023 RepID=UPI00225E36CA|nr:ATP-binding cassette domain-containing protein [Anianabacter salinae]MBV0912292.1 ATP-binding cassette domain-containing protein [Anianabacter salinae]
MTDLQTGPGAQTGPQTVQQTGQQTVQQTGQQTRPPLGDVILETRDLTKHYGGVHALEGANFSLRRGEHVAIMGDHGAGKSTFVRQITAVEQRTRGEVIFDGRPVNFEGPLDAREAGIETVFQTPALADHLDVSDNLFLGRERTMWNWLGPFRRLDYKAMRADTMTALQKTGVKIPSIRNTIENMSGGQRQCVAIARTATFHSKLTIMDEPTAALGVQETAQVENIIRTLKEAGEPLILISHNMRQVMDLCDRIVVFRQGRNCANLRVEDTTGGDVFAYITGAKTQAEYADAA